MGDQADQTMQDGLDGIATGEPDELGDEEALVPEVTAVARRPAATPTPRQAVSMIDFLSNIASPEALEANQKLSAAYDQAVRSLVGPNDVVVDKGSGREFKRKSAWKKLARFFQVSTQILERRTWYDTDDGTLETRHFNAEVVVRATAPWGQFADAIGLCSTREEKFLFMGVVCPKCGGPTWDNREPRASEHPYVKKLRAEGKLPPFGCRNKQCGGEVWQYDEAEVGQQRPNPTARAKALHDCTATAQTRASNRAISDLIAAGEVSAEEVEGGAVAEPADAQDQRAAQAAGPDLSLLQAKVGGKGKMKDRTWQEVLDDDRGYVEFMVGRKADKDGNKKPRVRKAALLAALVHALDHKDAEAATAASHEPPTQEQYDALRDLLDVRDFSGKPEWKAWAGNVLNSRVNPSRAGMEEALTRFREQLPELVPATEEGPDDTDDLPF